jgi:pilus assembly protein CpaB
VQAYVAAKTIDSGTSLKDAVAKGLAKQETLPRKTVPSDAITKLSPELESQVAVGDIPAGTLLQAGGFGIERVQSSGLPIPAGKLAVGVALEDPQRVGGFVKPGSQIAIFDTFNTVVGFNGQGELAGGNHDSVAGDGLADGHGNNRATRLLLSRVAVLAVGSSVAAPQTLHRTGDADNGQKVSQNQVVIVTVAVTQHDAEKLIQAIQTGHLYFGLLASGSQVQPGPGVDNTNLFQ